MAETIVTREGRVETIFDFRDALDIVEDGVGYDLRRFLEREREEFEESIRDEFEYGYEYEDDSHSSDDSGSGRDQDVKELEKKNAHYAHILKGIAEDAQDVIDSLSERRVYRKKILAFCETIINKVQKEFGED